MSSSPLPVLNDEQAMRLALQLASDVRARTPPNPAVGCVILNERGQVIGQGATMPVGGPHAEVMALKDAKERGHSVRGSTVAVTLEPCAHHGRTPPCVDALIAAQVGRVLVAVQDPFEQVSGRGIDALKAAGIKVELGLQAEAARALNLGFFSRVIRKRPWVRLKVAISLDGRTALPGGQSQWITGPLARADGHQFRAQAGAILTGVGTIRDDDPRMSVRLEGQAPASLRQPPRVIVDSRLETSLDAKVLAEPGEVWIYGANSPAEREQALRARANVQVHHLPGASGKVDLPALMKHLAERGVNELHVEAGSLLNASLLRESCVDELLVYMAPKLLGDGRALAAMPALTHLADATPMRLLSLDAMGDDVRLRYVLNQRDRF